MYLQDGSTALHIAALNGLTDCVLALLSARDNVHLKDNVSATSAVVVINTVRACLWLVSLFIPKAVGLCIATGGSDGADSRSQQWSRRLCGRTRGRGGLIRHLRVGLKTADAEWVWR